MTKKDFGALASAFIRTKPLFIGDMDSMAFLHHSLEYNMWKDCVIAVMEACIADNPKFDKGKFMTACGVPNIGLK